MKLPPFRCQLLPRLTMLLQLLLLLLVASVLVLMTQRATAGSHYCPGGDWQLVIDISRLGIKDATLVPEAGPGSGSITGEVPAQCSWKVTATGGQLVMLGAPSEHWLQQQNGTQSSALQYVMRQQGGRHFRLETVFPGMLTVIPLTGGATTIEVSMESNGGHSPVNLRILIPHPGFCGRDMLSFHGNCHAVSPLPSNVTVSMSNIRGDAQLASFISMSQVKSFIAANEARRGVHPYRRALELSQAVRLGMFYSAIPHATILSVVRNESGCVLQELLERPEEMLATAAPVTGACGSLRVDESGRAVMEFGDCSKPMLSLMSFPETASSAPFAQCQECGEQQKLKVEELMKRLSEAGSANVGSSIWIAVSASIVFVAAALAAGLILALVIFKRRKFEYLPPSQPVTSAASFPDEAEPVASIRESDCNEMEPLNPSHAGNGRSTMA